MKKATAAAAKKKAASQNDDGEKKTHKKNSELTPAEKRKRQAQKAAKKEKKALAAGGNGGSQSGADPPAPFPGAPPRKKFQQTGNVKQKCWYFQSWYHDRTCTDVLDPKRGCKYTHEMCMTDKEFRDLPVPPAILAERKKADKTYQSQGIPPTHPLSS